MKRHAFIDSVHLSLHPTRILFLPFVNGNTQPYKLPYFYMVFMLLRPNVLAKRPARASPLERRVRPRSELTIPPLYWTKVVVFISEISPLWVAPIASQRTTDSHGSTASLRMHAQCGQYSASSASSNLDEITGGFRQFGQKRLPCNQPFMQAAIANIEKQAMAWGTGGLNTAVAKTPVSPR